MATTKVSKVENILKIEIVGGETTYGNAAWYEIVDLDATSVTLLYQGGARPNYTRIEFVDFEDDLANTYTTVTAVLTYLSDKIG